MKKGIIFDLDQTLVDSNVAKPYRSAHNWSIGLFTDSKIYII